MLARVVAYAEEQAAVVASRLRSLARRHRPIDAARPQRLPAPMSREDNWTRATGAITTALAGFERIQGLQAAAVSQIDAADYVLQSLLKELRMAMPIPADGAPLRAILAEATRPAPARKALAA